EGKVIEVDEPNNNLKEGDLRNLYEVDLKVSELKYKNKNIKMCIPMI
ncbi:MAG: ABC transporter ATP-binding protein, partial [Tissierellia bacterium]|nr:ABC transporter ATP-binding protein [Tissierellia bacterium]